MKALIVEDEKAALRNLKAVLAEIDADIEVAGEVDSVADTLEWLVEHPVPDLLFLDIHLADGSAFELFEHVEIVCPVIFTTAYDEYALRAFKVNSVDYLLKPINKTDLQRALDKLALLRKTSGGNMEFDYRRIVQELRQEKTYKTHFLIPVKGDRLLPVSVDTILYFYIADGTVKAVDKELKEMLFPQTLDELTEVLNPQTFFRANRQFLISRQAVQDVVLWFNGRLAVNLKVSSAEKVIISKARVADFKEWFCM